MKFKSLFFISLLGCISSANTIASECSALLQNGVFNHYSFNSSKNSQAEVHNALCDFSKEIIDTSKTGSSGMSFGISVGEDKFSFGSSKQGAKDFKKVYESQICSAEN
jgi:hypothetical protein